MTLAAWRYIELVVDRDTVTLFRGESKVRPSVSSLCLWQLMSAAYRRRSRTCAPADNRHQHHVFTIRRRGCRPMITASLPTELWSPRSYNIFCCLGNSNMCNIIALLSLSVNNSKKQCNTFNNITNKDDNSIQIIKLSVLTVHPRLTCPTTPNHACHWIRFIIIIRFYFNDKHV